MFSLTKLGFTRAKTHKAVLRFQPCKTVYFERHEVNSNNLVYVAGKKGFILASELSQFFAIFQDNRQKGN